MLDTVHKNERIRGHRADRSGDARNVVANPRDRRGMQDRGHPDIRRHLRGIGLRRDLTGRIIMGHADIGFARLFRPMLCSTARGRMLHR